MDLLLSNEHDIVFVNGACPVTNELRQVVAQRLTIRLLTFLGEWFLDTTYGVPHYQRILGKKTSKQAVDNIFQEQILLDEDVLEITSFSSTFTNRNYSLNFKARTIFGETDVINITSIGS